MWQLNDFIVIDSSATPLPHHHSIFNSIFPVPPTLSPNHIIFVDAIANGLLTLEDLHLKQYYFFLKLFSLAGGYNLTTVVRLLINIYLGMEGDLRSGAAGGWGCLPQSHCACEPIHWIYCKYIHPAFGVFCR